MSRKGRDFELNYEWLFNLNENYKVISPGFIYDKIACRNREVDILIQYYDEDNFLRTIAIECRDRKKVEDVIWIEQLKTKREDLELDFIIATTTRTFSRSAIEKARHHGIIIEKSEIFNKSTIEDTINEFLIDIFFLKFDLLKLNFIQNNKVVSYKELISTLPFYQQCTLKQEINIGLYLSFDPHSFFQNHKFNFDLFFEKSNNSEIVINQHFIFNENIPIIFNELNITRLYAEIKIKPLKVTLPLNKSLSVFEVKEKKNKRYIARFGNDEEYAEYGYLDNNQVFGTLKLKKRKYYRFIEMNMHLNTIFPDLSNLRVDIDPFIENGIGEFDFSYII